jgi:hypothetical protein
MSYGRLSGFSCPSFLTFYCSQVLFLAVEGAGIQANVIMYWAFWNLDFTGHVMSLCMIMNDYDYYMYFS